MSLYTHIRREHAGNIFFEIAIAFVLTLLIALAAKISVPFYPVPMTMQTAAILGISLIVGMKRAAFVIGLYLFEGALGLPVFTGTPERGIGLAYMTGPTGGYLAGFMMAAIFAGYMADRGWGISALKAVAVSVMGTAIILLPGLLWLGVLFGWSFSLLETGLYPFVLGGLFKSLLVGLAVSGAWRLMRKSGD
ncbi:biotin transporter BioY [Thalassospiraceae bacterium LMO-JJ14]|nr:biotin transporter BioY [Thalassospiraceae bacterium LMO-JJ14]